MMQHLEYDLTSQESALLEQSLAESKRKTSVKLVPVIVKSSSAYEHGALTFGFVFSLLVYTIVWIIFSQHRMIALNNAHFLFSLLILIIGFSVGTVVATYIPSIKLLLTKKHEQHDAVKQRAAEAFFHYHFDVNKHHDGVLIYVSLLEHMVRIQAESHVYEKLSPEQWQAIVMTISDELTHGDIAVALTHGVDHCAQLLSQHFPPSTA